jgi:hypothetical protein
VAGACIAVSRCVGAVARDRCLRREASFDRLRPLGLQELQQGLVPRQAEPSWRADLPAQNLTELFALARRSDAPMNFASWGQASTAHLVFEKTRVDQKIAFTHVPYKGGMEIISGLLAGDVQVGIADLLSPAAHLRTGRLKLLGVTGG